MKAVESVLDGNRLRLMMRRVLCGVHRRLLGFGRPCVRSMGIVGVDGYRVMGLGSVLLVSGMVSGMVSV